MTVKEMNDALLRLADKHEVESCPNSIIKEYWNKYKDLEVEDFERVLEKQFKKFSDADFMEAEAQIEEGQVRHYKRKVADLLKELLSNTAGHAVLQDMGDYFGFEIHVDESEVSVYMRKEKEEEESEKCPDALTPDILEILRGKKD